MENFLNRIQKIHPISKDNFDLLSSKLEMTNFKKKDKLISDGGISKYVYFINKGAVRSYYIKEDKEVTLWFGFEGDIAVSLNNFVNQKPSAETIELLEDTSFYRISLSNLLYLYASNLELANWGRRLAEVGLLEMEQQILSIRHANAGEKWYDIRW